jgi:alkanesulfonate monooxygenase SsuD/methylene tetrahydromethanopterin reductase-like flavin-dependent oxidoreductase (luciferase family)
MLATGLADLSGGRFALGLGAGSPQLAEGLHEVAFRAPVERLGAVARQVRRLLDGERVVTSEAVDVPRGLRLGVRSTHSIPLNLAALGPRSVRLCGQIADGWVPFLLPVSELPKGLLLLQDGAARAGGRPVPAVCPAIPAAVSPDPAQARALASWWIGFYLTKMGPLYATGLRAQGFGPEVDAVLAADPSGISPLPAAAQVLIDELTLCGDGAAGRAGLDRWYAAGAAMPTVVLPPDRSLDELIEVLESLRPR